MKTYWGIEVQLHSFFSLDGEEWLVSRSCRFTASERDPDTHWIGGWAGPRPTLDTVSKRRNPSTRREPNPDHPACSQSLYRL